MRYYAGNWATSQWLFRKDDRRRGEARPRRLQGRADRGRAAGEASTTARRPSYLLEKGLAFRAMHSHGRALNGLLAAGGRRRRGLLRPRGRADLGRRQRLELRRRPLPRPSSCSRRSRSSAGSSRGETCAWSRSSRSRRTSSASATAIYDAADRAGRGGLGRRRRHGQRGAVARGVLGLPGRGRPPAREAEPSPRRSRERARSSSAPGPNGLACAVALAREGVEVTVLEAEDDDRRRHPHRRADGPRPAPRRLLGGAPDGGRLAVPATRSTSSATGSSGAGPRSTSPTRSTTAAPGVMLRSIEQTAAGARRRRAAWRRVVRRPSAAAFDALDEDILRPILHLPTHPLRLVRFGLPRGDARRPCSRARGGRRRRGRSSAASPPTPSARSTGR